MTVGTVKKSKATMASRWFAKNVRHRPAGSPLRRVFCRCRATVRSETSNPSFRSSPWMRGAPQPEFSSAIRRISFRSSSFTFGRPPRRRDRHRQYRRKPLRCHATTVSGFTITKAVDQRGQICRRMVQKSRSSPIKRGRVRLRLSTATCWRSARISSEASARVRKKTLRAATTARNRSNTPTVVSPEPGHHENGTADFVGLRSFVYTQ